ncbi:hypothetical protein Csa_007303 [Cucumis sativus]|uniref:Uncharacterized protein n=1 Tax=Cucumis sativus TaxID=3659 RepID=A0A0A0LYS7_CUCSA|nr:hypothetical protein Csa_007303 [Cucumis sativus]
MLLVGRPREGKEPLKRLASKAFGTCVRRQDKYQEGHVLKLRLGGKLERSVGEEGCHARKACSQALGGCHARKAFARRLARHI